MISCVTADDDLDAFIQRMLSYVLRHEHCIKSVTEDACLSVVVWSLNLLAEGKWPETDPDGVPWPKHSYRAKRAGKTLTPLGHRATLVSIHLAVAGAPRA